MRARRRSGARRRGGGRLRHPLAELQGSRQVEVAPRAALGLVAELRERVGEQLPRLLISRIGCDDVIEHLRDPPVLALLEVQPRPGDDLVRAAHVLDDLAAGLGGRERVETGRVAVEPAEVVRPDGLHVVIDAAVVATIRPVQGELGGELDQLGGLDHVVAVVCEP